MRTLLLLSLVITSGCAEKAVDGTDDELAPGLQTLGERSATFSYVPLDPLKVDATFPSECGNQAQPAILNFLPDNAVRISIRQMSGSANLELGPSALGVQGQDYQVILDYINVDTSNIPFLIGWKRPTADNSSTSADAKLTKQDIEPINYSGSDENATRKISQLVVQRLDTANDANVVIPVYVGVGLRLTATIRVKSGEINLSSIGAIAAAVEANEASGSLVVQTLGINGPQVAANMPLPSELNVTTVQGAIQSLGAIKAIMYEGQNTRIVPRVTGMYSPLPVSSRELTNRIVSELAREAIPWTLPCLGSGDLSSVAISFPSRSESLEDSE